MSETLLDETMARLRIALRMERALYVSTPADADAAPVARGIAFLARQPVQVFSLESESLQREDWVELIRPIMDGHTVIAALNGPSAVPRHVADEWARWLEDCA